MPNFTFKKFISYYLISLSFLFFPFTKINAQNFIESFKYNSIPSSLHMDGAPSAFLTGGFGTRDGYNDLNTNGYLRLTNTNTTQKAILWSTIPFSSAKEISASFEYYIHSGNGGDGIAFILFDENTPTPLPGEFGGSLGYAQANGQNGFTNGYLGIGIDEYGNFSSNAEGRTGGPGSMESAIVLRGKGNGTLGYPYLTGAKTQSSPFYFDIAGNDRTATDPSKAGFRKIDILLKPRPGGGFFVSVYLTHGNTKSLIIDNYAYTTVAPANLRFAITASTGLYTNFHEIRNLNVSSLYQPIANPDSFSGIVGVPATSGDITANDNGTINAPATLDKTSVDLDLDSIGIQNSITVVGKGTLTYDSVTGKVTFIPLNNTIEGPVQINYTFNDTFGKTSTVATIIYNSIKITGVDMCPGGTGSLVIEPSIPRTTTAFSGHWNSQTDPKAFIPNDLVNGFLVNTANCSFSTNASRNYTATEFSVTRSGIYVLKMTDSNDYDGMAYIYSGNFVPGKCNAGGTWIIGDDDFDGRFTEPRLTVYLQSGVKYTLISTLWAYNDIGVYSGDYSWTVTPPPGGQFLLTPLNYWYTSASGGKPIGWGPTFNPVGVTNSGLANTNTPGTTIYYVGDETNAPRFPVSFTIEEYANAGPASSSPTACINTDLVSITHNTANSTGIGIPTGLPSGVTPTWASNLITISGIPTQSGTFNYSIPIIGECGNNVATGKITVITKANDIITTSSICSGQNYTWPANGIVYTTSQTGLRISNNGCMADQVLNLTVTPKPADSITTQTICSGQTYTWPANGIVYTTSQTGLRINNDGCTADLVLNLTVTPKPADVITTKSICAGESYKWIDNVTYTTSQNGLRISNDGCTADQVLNLNVAPKPADIITTQTICSKQNYTWPANGISYSASQNGIRISNDGCTADQVLNLTVGSKPADVITTESICSGQNYTWPANGITYSASQTGLRINNDGCTADQVLNLTVGTKPSDVVTTESICAGESYKWIDNVTYTTSQNGLRINNDGCTADQVLNLTIGTKPSDVVTTESICAGESYKWIDNVTYTTSQNGLRISNDGCTADQVLNLTVGTKPLDIVTTLSICSGESYKWINDVTYTTSQNGLRISNDGCTADHVLNLTVGTKPLDIVTTKSICSGDSYTWHVNGITYSVPQIGVRISNDGCTADQVLNLTVGTKPSDIVTTESICAGESYKWINNVIYTTSQNGIRINNDGCTADQVLNLTITPKPMDIITTQTICSGQNYTWPANGISYSASQTGLRINNDGCTADQVLNLTVGTKPLDIVTTESICAGESYKWINDVTYTTSQNGIRISNDGCTADHVLNLTVGIKPSDVVTTQSICVGESYKWIDNVTYTTSQNGIRISNDGCTADQVLNLTVGTKPSDVVTTESICAGESYKWIDNVTYTTSQNGIRISNDGCTADQVLNLTVGTKPSDVVTTESICAGESYKWIDNVTYTTSQNGLRISNDGCTADQVLNLIVGTKPSDVVTTKSICAGQTYTWPANGIIYSVSQTELRISNDGCSADQVLNLIVGTKPSDVVTTKSICAGQTYTWPANGIIYSVSQTELRISNDGCTADQVLNLIVALPLRASVITNSVLPELCTGENNGSFSIEISGGIAPYKVSLNQSDGVYGQVIGMEHSFSNISASKQIVYIKDALDCTFELQVNMPESIILNPVATVNYGCSVNSVKISVDVSTNLNDIDYALDNGSYQKDNLFTNLSAGLHTIAARHTNGCSKSTKPFIIKHFEPLELSLTTGELNEIVASATGGGGEYQYSFEDQSFSKDDKFIIYKSGNYKVSVIDKNGCSTTVTQYFAYIDVCTPNYFTPNADGVNDEWGPDCTVNYKNLTYTIIDRYGREIANYHYGQKWDGKYNGKELTSGDYWYVIKLNDPKDHREFVGHFTLYR